MFSCMKEQSDSSTNPKKYKDPGILPQSLQLLRSTAYAHAGAMFALTKAERELLKSAGIFKQHRNYVALTSKSILDGLNRLEVMISAGVISPKEFEDKDGS